MCPYTRIHNKYAERFSKAKITSILGLSWWLSGKESPCNAGNSGSISGLGRSPGGGNGNPLQSSCLGSPMDRGVCWQVTVLGWRRVMAQTQLSTSTSLLLNGINGLHLVSGETGF